MSDGTDGIDRVLRVRVVAGGLPATPKRNPWRCRAVAGLALVLAFGTGAELDYIGIIGNATVLSVLPNVGDTDGGGGRVVVEVDSSSGATTITAGGVAFTDFAIDDGTHVSGVPGAHASGVVDVVVTNGAGDSTGGESLFEYWTPLQLTGILRYLDSGKGVTHLLGAISDWADQTGTEVYSAGDSPTLVANSFGTVPGVLHTPTNHLDGNAGGVPAQNPYSMFAVVKTTATADYTTATTPTFNPGQSIWGGAGWSDFGIDGDKVALKVYDVALQSFGSGINNGNPHLIGITGDATPTLYGYIGATQVGGPSSLGGTPNVYFDRTGGYGGVDGMDGLLGACIILGQVIDPGELIKLHSWSMQRFGTT